MANEVKSIRKAVIPAAGFGTRLLPATKAQPKEMLPIVDKPVIQYVVEEALEAGITDILIIIAEGKEVLQEHFKTDLELEELLQAKGKLTELEAVRNFSHRGNIQFIYQHEQKGLGDAVLCAEQFVGGEPFAVLLGDTIIEASVPLTAQLMQVFLAQQSTTIALEEVPLAIAHRYGVFVGGQVTDTLLKGTEMVEKPPKDKIPSNKVFAGRYVFTPAIFKHLHLTPRGVNDEVQLTDAIRLLMAEEDVYGHVFEGKRHDVGNKLDFIKTNLLFGLNNSELKADLQQWLKELKLS